MGDVNADMTNSAWNLVPRTSSSLPLYLRETASGSYEVILSRDADVYGLQFSVDARNLELIEGALPVSANNLTADKNGLSRISWGQTEPLSLEKGTILFTIENLPADQSIHHLLSENEDGLYPEIYTNGLKNEKIELLPYSQGQVPSDFESKVSPNPFSETTMLEVTVPVNEEFTVSLYNIKGQEIFSRKYISYKAKAEIEINDQMVTMPGIYYYKVKASLGELTGKFVRQ
jgi:hypothetical protein